jgi:hypothetical protein
VQKQVVQGCPFLTPCCPLRHIPVLYFYIIKSSKNKKMKKLVLILQILGLVTVCPLYVALELTHATNNTSENPSSSNIKIKSDNKSTQISPDIKTKIQSNTSDYHIK